MSLVSHPVKKFLMGLILWFNISVLILKRNFNKKLLLAIRLLDGCFPSLNGTLEAHLLEGSLLHASPKHKERLATQYLDKLLRVSLKMSFWPHIQ